MQPVTAKCLHESKNCPLVIVSTSSAHFLIQLYCKRCEMTDNDKANIEYKYVCSYRAAHIEHLTSLPHLTTVDTSNINECIQSVHV